LYTALGLAIVCAITSHGRRATNARNSLEVLIPPGLPVKGIVLPHQLRTIDRFANGLTTSPYRSVASASRHAACHRDLLDHGSNSVLTKYLLVIQLPGIHRIDGFRAIDEAVVNATVHEDES
jgi:mRNA-degrading endonuclease toxin of MazEF toxin-antitoxin module